MPISAAPTEVWVDDDGPDNGMDHFDTIQEGVDAVATGGTVYVAAGTYTGSSSNVISIAYKNISLLGEGEDTTFVDGQNIYRCIYTQNLNSSSIIDGFTFENGSHNFGAGMYNTSSSPTITNCTFSNNTANLNGGGICNYNYSPTITNCTFSNNTADYGGGMYSYKSSSIITNCTFSDNTADYGGGMYYELMCHPTITNCIFENNVANFNGGGILYRDYSNPTMKNCIFDSNAGMLGGGIYNADSSPKITNCIFSYNTASQGGGVYNYYSNSIVTNCTFSNNVATSSGSSMYNTYSNPKITNCILWGGCNIELFNEYNSYPTVTYSDIQGWYLGIGNINTDPLFVNAAGGNLRLSTGSPCIDTGAYTNDPSYGGVTDDIEGTLRPVGSTYDMGAYESGPPVVTLAVVHDHCPGTATFNATTTGGDGNYTYSWGHTGDGDFTDPGDSSTATVTGYDTSGTVSVTATDGNADSDTDSAGYDINPQLTVTVGIVADYPCMGQVGYMAEAHGGDGSYSYSWTVTGSGTPTPTGNILAISGFGTSGTISLTVTDGNGCTVDYGPFDYNINPQLLVSLFVNYEPGKAIFTALPIGGDSNYTYDWDLAGDGTYELVGTTSNTQTLVGHGASGTAFVRVTDGNGCKANDWADYEIERVWSPIVMKPLVMVALSNANTVWECLLQELPEELPKDILALLDDVQLHMENATMLSNPVFANGELNMAMYLMGQINDALDCGCYHD